MQTSEPKVKIGTITFNDFGNRYKFYSIDNIRQFLSTLQTRRTKTDRQGAHGVDDSLSWYDERGFPAKGRIVAPTQAERVSMEWELRKQLRLSALQSYGGVDGYFLMLITWEDGTLLQCYAKVVDTPGFDFFDTPSPKRSSVSFVLAAKDPNLYSQTLQQQTTIETVSGTNFTIVESSSPTIPFQLYGETGVHLTCTNNGIEDSPPVLTIHGPTANPQVLNVTTGLFMNLTKAGGLTLLSGEKVVIDVVGKTITKYDASLVATNASGYLSDSSQWIVFAPGDNQLTLEDDSADAISATISADWRDTYI